MIETRELSNGVTVLLEQSNQTDTVSIGFWFPFGSRDEKKGERGLTHFLEHMLFKGTKERSAYQIAREIDRIGGLLNAFTEKEVTCFYCTVPKESITVAIDLLSDMINNSLIDESELLREKLVIINELRSVEDSPEDNAHELYLRKTWGNHPLALKITGEEDDVKKITRDRVVDFYRSRFIPVNLLISVAGNIIPDRIIDYLESKLGKHNGNRFKVERVAPKNNSFTEIKRSKFSQVQIYTGIPFEPSVRIEDYYTMLVLSTIFGESISSRLFQVLREELGLCYTVYSFRTYFTDSGIFSIYASTGPRELERLLVALKREIKRFVDEPPGIEEIDDAKTHLKGTIVLVREDMETRMKRLARQYLMRKDVYPFEKSFKYIEAVSRESVVDLIKGLIRIEDFNFLLYGKIKNVSRINKIFQEA